MKNTRLLLTFLMTVGCWSAGASLPSAQPGERQLTGTWSAQWICDGGFSPYDYGVYRFRKRLDLPKKPERFVINISADNRYRLLVNGQEACWGPARGDLNRWYYETVDIAPLLRPGQNVLAVTVWNLGPRSPGAQISRQTGLIVQGNSSVEDDVNTDGSWLVLRDESFSPLFNCPEAGYIGGHDRIDGTK